MKFLEFKEKHNTSLSTNDLEYIQASLNYLLESKKKCKFLPALLLLDIDEHSWSVVIEVAEKFKKNGAFI